MSAIFESRDEELHQEGSSHQVLEYNTWVEYEEAKVANVVATKL